MWVLKSIQCYSWLITWNFTIHQDAYFQIRFYLIFLETVDWKRILLSLLSLFIVVINHVSYSIIFIAIILFVSTILMIVSVIIVFIYIWFYYFIMWSWWVALLAPPYQVWFDSIFIFQFSILFLYVSQVTTFLVLMHCLQKAATHMCCCYYCFCLF